MTCYISSVALSKATLEKLLRDTAEHIWAFLSACVKFDKIGLFFGSGFLVGLTEKRKRWLWK